LLRHRVKNKTKTGFLIFKFFCCIDIFIEERLHESKIPDSFYVLAIHIHFFQSFTKRAILMTYLKKGLTLK
jgi:hypothetical protein